jgi:branched-chain amino acid transport system substrate-binding protein
MGLRTGQEARRLESILLDASGSSSDATTSEETAMKSPFKQRFSVGLLGSSLAIALGPHSAASAEELRIGFLAPTTGIFGQVGKDMVDGFQLYLDETTSDFGGARVTLIVEDTIGKPDTAVTKAKKLILQDRVHLLVGGLLASTGYALAPVSTSEKTVYIPSIAAADDLTQRELSKYPYMIRTGWSSSQPSHPFGQWACEQGYKKIVTIGADYAFGYEVVGGFQKSFEDCGGKIIQKIWPPLGTKDFGPYIPSIDQNADAIFTLMVGPMSLQFPKQLAAAGNEKPVLGGGTSYDEFVLPSMGDEVIGHVSALQYSAALDTPKNAEFVKAYRAKYGKVPSYYSESNYTTAHMIDEVLRRNKGRFPGPKAFVQQLAEVKVDAPRGPVTIDEMRNPVQNVYIKKVEKRKMFGYTNDELWNTVIKTYPNVGQFWTYDKEAFLKQPVYSRDFPPCKFCE